MNREDAAKLWHVLKAYSEGEDVQVHLDRTPMNTVGWWDVSEIQQSWLGVANLRVKPKPRTIAIVYSERTERIIQHGTVVMPGEKVITVELPE